MYSPGTVHSQSAAPRLSTPSWSATRATAQAARRKGCAHDGQHGLSPRHGGRGHVARVGREYSHGGVGGAVSRSSVT